MQHVLFYRNFRRFYGGHLKVWHYFNHVRSSPDHTAHIYFSRETVWDASNPWLAYKEQALADPQAISPDVIFLAGLDWLMLEPEYRDRSSRPIINLIQGVRHGHPHDPRYAFLPYKAIRICVSEEVATAITESCQVQGPIWVIPNGIDLAELPPARTFVEKTCDLLIMALKQPELGRQLLHGLVRPNRHIEIVMTRRVRQDFLDQLSRAKITLFLPHETEGFYLPALEGMALGTVVVCPDCLGNRSFCVSGYNCFRPAYTIEEMMHTVEVALQMASLDRNRMFANAKATVARHDLMHERRMFLKILEDVMSLWRD